MTRGAIRQLLAVVALNWPRVIVDDELIGLWDRMLSDLGYQEAHDALVELIATSRYQPVVADLRSMVFSRRVGAPTPEEAWSEVMVARGCRGTAEILWSHRLVEQTVDALGGMFGLYAEGDRARETFTRFYRGLVESAVRRANMGSLGRVRAEALTGSTPREVTNGTAN